MLQKSGVSENNVTILDSKVHSVIVVLNYNDSETCISFIQETRGYGSFDRLIIVDNKSTDDSIERIQQYLDERIILLPLTSNDGYASGNNAGMKYAVNRFPNLETIIISNPDIHVRDEDIRTLVSVLNKGYGMTTGLIYNYNRKTDKKRLASNFGWMLPSYLDMLSNCFLLTYKIRRSILHTSFYLDWDKVKEKKIIETEAVPGCFFLISVPAAKEIDFFDDETFLFGEETILGWKLKQKKFKACIVNNVDVLHENSISINKSISSTITKEKYRIESEKLYLNKYLGCNTFLGMVYSFAFWLGLSEKWIIMKLINYVDKE